MHAFFRTLVARLLASTFLAACAPGDDGGPPTSTTATDTGATDADASDSGATDASDADATGATGRPDVVVETVRVSVCAMACTTAADCCANGISGCPGEYPMNWSCEDGYCAFGGCSSHDDCQSPFVRNLECHPFGGVGTCIDPCDRDDDCPGGLTCSGRADDGTAVCAGATGCRSDEDCGGLGRCDASGACVCEDAGDCTLTATTPGGWGCRSMEVVVDPVRACYDRQQNGGETGVDCGGPCGACPGAVCDGGGGCASGVCAGGACVAPTCTDGARNGRETGVDCGGTCPNDCPSCHDEIRNQDESDVDCGGQCGACGLDQRCAGPADCGGAPCVAGVCGCPSGRHLCDGECVRDDDASRCGAQCEVCRTSSGTVACVGGECVATCYGGYHACGGTCEADDSIHACGPDCVACPTPAHSATRCVDGMCEWECDPNYRLCGDTCKAIDSPGACGDACVVCPAPTAGGYATCDGGVCGLACSDGYRLCPGDRCVADGLTCNGRRRCEAHAQCAYDEVCGYVYSESETVCSTVCTVASDCAGGEVCAKLPGSLQIGFCQTARVTGRPDGSACTSDSECKSTLCHYLDKVCVSACARPTDCAHCGIDSGPGGSLHYRSDCGSARLEAGATCPRNSACESMACEDVCRQLCVSNGDCPEGETCQVNLGSTQPADGVLPMHADDAPVAHHDASAACYFASIGPVPFGEACANDRECETGWCARVDGGGLCLAPCMFDADCPAGGVCATFDADEYLGWTYRRVCVPGEALPPSPHGGHLVINEVDYDQPGDDTAEFVELLNGGATPIDLSGFELVVSNPTAGGGGDAKVALSGSLAPGQYAIIASHLLVVAPGVMVAGRFPKDTLQNGPSDGVRLVSLAGERVDALIYEAGNAPPANVSAMAEGLAFPDGDSNTVAGQSLARCPNGTDSDDNKNDFALTSTTPGFANACD